jgi:hypothetical protein
MPTTPGGRFVTFCMAGMGVWRIAVSVALIKYLQFSMCEARVHDFLTKVPSLNLVLPMVTS